MKPRRGATSLAGILPIDKPTGMTSHDVVSALRRASGEKRIGHTGTLDPMATGLLVLLIGRYARLQPYLSSQDKVYEARVAFGRATDTEDAEGAVTATADVPAELFERRHAEALLAGFVGPSDQVPPAYSAIKVDGRTSHRVARGGGEPLLESRPITVHSVDLLSSDPAAGTWDVRFHVSKGTYVRSLARDIGLAAGTVAHLAALRRLGAGPLTIEDARTLQDAESAAAEGHLTALFADPLAVLGLPTLEALPDDVASGRSLRADAGAYGQEALVALTVGGMLGAVYRVRGETLVAECVVWSAP